MSNRVEKLNSSVSLSLSASLSPNIQVKLEEESGPERVHIYIFMVSINYKPAILVGARPLTYMFFFYL